MVSLSAQVLPVLNSFQGRTFTGPIDVSWPVSFEGCIFVTDSVVLHRSYGAVFRNCTFQSISGTLYIADRGSGMILADCDVRGCSELRFSRNPLVTDRNYITDVRLDSDECTVLDEQETIIDIDGLDLAERALGHSEGPMIMIMSGDRKILRGAETAHLQIRGLDSGDFVGWSSSDDDVKLSISVDGLNCSVSAPSDIPQTKGVIITAYTECGLQAAFGILLVREVIARK